MTDITFTLKREVFTDHYTLGTLFADGEQVAYTCEDADRDLETGGTKLAGETAIPRGRYRLTVDMSKRFSQLMPLIKDVPQFSGVRIHGGNSYHDTEGCPLIGAVRTTDGVACCRGVVNKLVWMVRDAERVNDKCWIEVC